MLNDDDTDHVQMFPSIDVSPDGTVHAMWGDLRDSTSQIALSHLLHPLGRPG